MLTKAHIRFLQDLRQKKSHRDEHQLFIAEGPKVVHELLTAPNIHADEIYATDSWLAAHHYLVQEKSRFSMEVTQTELSRLSGLTTPNQVIGVFHMPEFPPTTNQTQNQRHSESASPGPTQAQAHSPITIALDTIQDPGNLGTIIRTADWFGIQHIHCSPTCADAFNPKVVQSTMGSLTRVQIHYHELQPILQQTRHSIYAATLNGQSLPTLKHQPGQPAHLLIGNESHGISPELLAIATHKITIPRHGHAESLNAAVATGIILSHLT